ncbi:hypothetical protein [Gottfriedia acidiceleris]|uniref:hypothetical protein n=1 Tax=Gottfriedia acidiceleris TaxID=371036 RepID=UPI002FFD6742
MYAILRDITKLFIKKQEKLLYSLIGKLNPDSSSPLESTYEAIYKSCFKDGLGCKVV